MASETHDSSAIGAAENLIRESERLRTKLQEERAALMERVRHIDRIMAALPRAAGAPSGAAIPMAGKSVPELVRWIVIGQPKGAAVGLILGAVRQFRPEVTAKQVHSAIYQLTKSKKIRRRGRKGASTYVAVTDGTAPRKEEAGNQLQNGAADGDALQDTAKMIAGQPDAVNAALLSELMSISIDAARVRLRRAKEKGLIKAGPVAGSYVAAGETGGATG